MCLWMATKYYAKPLFMEINLRKRGLGMSSGRTNLDRLEGLECTFSEFHLKMCMYEVNGQKKYIF